MSNWKSVKETPAEEIQKEQKRKDSRNAFFEVLKIFLKMDNLKSLFFVYSLFLLAIIGLAGTIRIALFMF